MNINKNMDEVKTIRTEAFGESSSSEEEEQILHAHCAENGENGKALPDHCLKKVIDGKESVKLMGFGCAKTFYLLINNQTCYHQSNKAMRFGELPGWAVELSRCINEVILFCNYVAELENCEEGKEACIFPQDLLWREPLFDQLIVNMYQPGEGICPHVDLMRFEDGIAIVSLESSCVMHFSRVENETCRAQDPQEKVPVLLTPGCLILMWGEARYLWKHEINRKPGFQIWEGQEIDQKRRMSVTLRKLCGTD